MRSPSEVLNEGSIQVLRIEVSLYLSPLSTAFKVLEEDEIPPKRGHKRGLNPGPGK
jgi:hypothetical protein